MLPKLSLFLLFIILLGYCIMNLSFHVKDNNYLHGTVIEITENELDEINMEQIQTVNIRIDEKDYNDKMITIRHVANLTYANHIVVKQDDQVIVWVDDNDIEMENCNIISYGRDKYLVYLIGLFALVIIIVGGKKGVFSIISLALTMALIFFMFFPVILEGVDPIIAAITVCVAATGITLLSIGGFSEKTYSAIAGTLGGTLFSILLTYVFGFMMNIQGTQDEDIDLISYSVQGGGLNLRDLLYAGIIIGSLGAIMDVCMSISSAMDEICETDPRITNTKLFLSGMHIGKDAIGTMSNTLILAYVGSSMYLLLVFYIYEQSLIQFVNGEGIASEILRTFTGSIGLVLSIPITSLSYLFFRKKRAYQSRIY